ncbi:MAG: GMC family oxidoreductase [Xanthobacteraceae bacterium]
MRDAKEYDYIIVGAGSAGCVLASRLTEDPDIKVLLLEAGKSDRHIWLKLPLKFRDLMTVMRFNWGYDTEPEPDMGGRSIYLPRGKVLGGSSSINGMMYCRCHPSDYDQWGQIGLRGWSYADVLPYFKRSEDFHGGANKFHGTGGPLTVSQADHSSRIHRAYVEAGKAAGHPHTTDHNTLQQEGFGPADLTIRNGRRASTSQVFLKPAMRRPNLTVLTEALAARVLFEKDRAVGLEFTHRGVPAKAHASREVILAGGTYNSPQLLMLSGIGPADELSQHGIKPVHASPNVGRNLQDHIHVGVAYRAHNMEDLDSELRADKLTLAVLNWVLFKRGYLTTLPVGCLAYIRTRPELSRPDIELLMGRLHPEAKIWFPGIKKSKGGFLGCRPTLIHPESRGTVTLRSGKFSDKPVIRHNYLSAQADLSTLRAGVRAARDVYAKEPLRGMTGDEIWPGKGVKSDAELDNYIRSTAITMYHPTSTCAMGVGPDAVVDGELRVNGVSGLRVVDASVMPNVPGGHTNAPTIMIAEKAVDMMLGRRAPERIEV